jgi:hypothetical protein
MRIITSASQKDYYDRYSDPTDNDCVWVRKATAVMEKEREVAPLAAYLTSPTNLHRIGKKNILTSADQIGMRLRDSTQGHIVWTVEVVDRWYRSTEIEYHPVYVVFCGRMYRGIKYVERHMSTPDSRPVLGFEPNCRYRFYWSANAFLAEHVQKEEKYSFTPQQEVKKWFEPNQSAVGNVCLDVHSPVLVYAISDNRVCWIKDALLKDLQFIKVLDPHTAFQELEMYVGGVMTRPEPLHKVSDKLKAAAHGMDERSFRKDPTKIHN